ncbi:MAG: WD40 repeat domain-containing protein [Desulfobulbus sp.]|jgi:WD40 repeat protein|uniref:WD40 repeat domain-containing protein n=1 Tax=Desulfobulbus sp. TaxID=895 RepID=UPI00284CFF33|nr:WD40 repeat domain-containing protein [Desulfobulbus sp.]MDR2549550.1 WD40 repeat domain-containing protein [Desulfobulbus sp.]
MTDDKQHPALDQTPDDEQPEIYGIVKGKDGIGLNRRSFLGAIAAAGALSACSGSVPEPAGSVPKKTAPPETTATCTGAPVKTAQTCGQAHEKGIEAIAIGKDGKSIVSWDPTAIKLWKLPDCSLKKTLPRDADATLSSDGKYLVACRGGQQSTAVKELPNATSLRTLPVRVGAPMAHGPDGKTLAFVGQEGIELWGLADGKRRTIIKEAAPPIRSLAFSPDNILLAAGYKDGSTKVWRLPEGEPMQTVQGPASPVAAVAIGPQGALLLSAHENGTAKIWRLPEGTPVQTMACHSGKILLARIAPGGDLAATASADGTVKLWKMPEGTLQATLKHQQNEKITSMAIGPDGQVLVTGSDSGRMHLWRLPEGELIGCILDPALTFKGTPMSHYRQTGQQTLVQPCTTPLPANATCVCDCVASDRSYRSSQTVCVCDTIAVPAGYAVAGGGVCTCNTIAVGSKSLPKGHKRTMSGTTCSCDTICTCNSVCSCVGNVSQQSHYWRPN